jgi:allophanate hydrolase
MRTAEIDLADVSALARACRSGQLRPIDVVVDVLDRIERSPRPEAWLHVVPRGDLEVRAAQLAAIGAERESMPLFGVPFAVKDNIDVAGLPTTAGCPAYRYVPETSAGVVSRLVAAGAVVIGKTHMDQFATGLVGTRSPHGPCRNAYNGEYISGGSSSGSAVVVAQRLVGFALGTDTAGSGRVPAALNGVVGLKPSRGLLSLDGVVPACASLDCVSIFSARCETAGVILAIARDDPPPSSGVGTVERFRFGVPAARELDDVDAEGRKLFDQGVERLCAIGGERVEIDFEPFRAVSSLLYSGPWIAERLAAVGDFVAAHPEAVDATVATLLRAASGLTARQAFEGMHALEKLNKATAPIWKEIDLLVVPTVARTFRIDEVMRRPIDTNAQLGVYNNFVNLLDLCGCTVPVGLRESGVPAGITLCAPRLSEALLLGVGARLERQRGRLPLPDGPPARISVAVVGAHLTGMPLNHQLVELGGRLERAMRTSPDYRLYALANTSPPKPGLRRVGDGGVAIEVEVWSLAPHAFGRFVAWIPRPLAMGRITLEDGTEVSGFVCEPEGIEGAEDISALGGWRAFVRQRG